MKPSSLRFAAAPLVLAGATASLLVFAATGCGSGGGSAPLPGFSSGLVSGQYSGRIYTGQVSLANGQIGNLNASVSGTTASGTLQIVDPTRAANPSRKTTAKTRLVIATPFLSGTFDPATGAINLTGSYVGANGQTIPISITGTLPAPPSTTGGILTVTINGQSTTTTFGGGTTNPTPTPSPSGSATPNPTPSASPSASPTPTPSPASGAVQFTLVSKSADCNFADPGISGWTISTAKFAGAAGQLYQFLSTIQGPNKNTGSFTVGWQRLKTAAFVPETFTFVPTPQIGAFGDDFQGILQTGVTIQTGAVSVGAWRPTGGTLTVVSVSGNKVTVRGEKVEFTPTPSPGTNGTGSFIADFTVTYDAVSGL